MIKVFIAHPPCYNCRIALIGFSFEARRAGAMEKRIPKRKVIRDVTATFIAYSFAGTIVVAMANTSISF
jgi:hypothetical protein